MGHSVVVWARDRGQGQKGYYPDLAGVDLIHADEYAGSLSQFLCANRGLFHTRRLCRVWSLAIQQRKTMGAGMRSGFAGSGKRF